MPNDVVQGGRMAFDWTRKLVNQHNNVKVSVTIKMTAVKS